MPYIEKYGEQITPHSTSGTRLASRHPLKRRTACSRHKSRNMRSYKKQMRWFISRPPPASKSGS